MLPSSFVEIGGVFHAIYDHNENRKAPGVYGIYQANCNAVAAGWLESEIRALHGKPLTEKQLAVLSLFRSRISDLEPWRQDAEAKLLIETVREDLESRSDDYGRLSYGADTSWQFEARDKLNEVSATLFDDLLEQEEREKAKDVERRAKCADIGRQLGLAN